MKKTKRARTNSAGTATRKRKTKMPG